MRPPEKATLWQFIFVVTITIFSMGLCNLALYIVELLSSSQRHVSHPGGPNTIDDKFLYASR